MSATGARAPQPVGSAAWIAAEKENVMHLVEQEMEEVEYPVRHEMEWLNEHMAEIFSKNQFNLTEIFKTPGKLRGKTPRTARKRNADEVRVPLSDIFSSNHQIKSISKAAPVPDQSAIKTADDNKGKERSQEHTVNVNQKLNSFSTYNTDSGYHGLPDDDEVVLTGVHSEPESSTQPIEEDFKRDTLRIKRPSVDRRTTEGSFHSAQEDIHQRGETVEPMDLDEEQGTKPDEDTPRPIPKAAAPPRAREPEEVPDVEPEPEQEQSAPAETNNKDGDTVLDNPFDDIGSPSDGSTPDRPLIRKSSLSFASLPAREPLMTKKSMGGSRISRTSHIDLAKLNNAGRPSYFSGQMGGTRTTQVLAGEYKEQNVEEDKMDMDGKGDALYEDTDVDLETTKLHHKSSTQRLHEKISLLGKFQPSRTNKSIPAVSHLAAAQVNYPELPDTRQDAAKRESRITPGPEPAPTEVDWIKPLGSPYRPHIPKSQTVDVMERLAGQDVAETHEKAKLERTQTFHDLSDKRSPLAKGYPVYSHHKSASTSTPSSPQRPGTRGNFVQNLATESTTPPVSPKRYDGALSTSKSKLQSLMKTAKGLFTSSAGVSAAAKLEALSSSPSASRSQPHLGALSASPERRTVQSPSLLKQPGTATAQSVTEPEEKSKQNRLKAKTRKEELPEMSREQEKPPVIPESKARQGNAQEKPFADREPHDTSTPAPSTRASPKKAQRPQAQTSREPESNAEAEMKFPLPPTSHHQAQPAKPNDRRPVRPTRETVQKPKPQPMSIRVGSTLSRPMPLSSTTSLSSSVLESNPPPAPVPATKQPTLTKKASNSSLQTTSSTSSFKSSVSSQTQRKAQLAAEKKKQEERRKEEQKRELERKRAAQQQQQEDVRRQELKNRAEAERRERERVAADDPKKVAQRQAIEQRRLENARRMERQGSQPPGAANDMQEKPGVQSSQRADMAPPRPPSRLGSIQPFSRSITQPPTNPVKPAKRGLDEESQSRPAAYQAADPKRRKTEDEHNPPPPVRPTMAPPIRQSNIRKEPAKPQIFAHGYAPAPPPIAHHQASASLYKNAAAGSHHVQQSAGASHRPGHPMDMAKYTSGKIPFAEAPNPSHTLTTAHKTPNQSSQRVAAKSSPQYQDGENIQLPDVHTDSEDEDSDADMVPVPRWAKPEELETLLRDQEGRDPGSIFGPIAPFSLEDTFKADKKIRKLRERGSSAHWDGPDGLTQEEIRRDLAERQRLRMNGGWMFN